MIDLKSEQLVHLTQAREYIPGQPHSGTIRRWFREGLRGITLETVMVGGRRFTSQEAISRFIERLSK